MDCGHSFSRKRPDKKTSNERVWFKLWIDDNFTVNQLIRLSGHSRSKLQRILLKELCSTPTIKNDLSQFTHIVFDGKYLFGREYCLLVILDALTKQPIAGTVVKAENKKNLLPWLKLLKDHGLSPKAVTTDGKQAAVYAFRELWSSIIIQRCLFHIKLQVRAWLRENPRYASTKALLLLVGSVCNITSPSQARLFTQQYSTLIYIHRSELSGFDPTHPIQSDALRAYSLIKYALKDCFHYLSDTKIATTTSALEGYFKQIQRIKGFDHNGLTQEHLFSFIAWKIHYNKH